MRNFVRVFSVIVLMVTILAETNAFAAKKYEGETMQVMIAIQPRSREQVMDYIAPRLKEKYGINLQGEEIGSKPLLEKLVVQRDKPRISVTALDTCIGVQAAEMELCETIDIEKAPNLKLAYDWAFTKVNGKLQVLSSALAGVSLIYNEDEFKRKGLIPPTSWYDLWRKDLSGRIAITALESTYGLAAFVTLARLEGGSEKNVEPAFKKIKTLLPNVHTVHTWSNELVKLMQLGEVWLGYTGNQWGAGMRATGFPAKWVVAKEGIPMVNFGMTIVKNAPYQDVAYDYMNLFYSTEFQMMRAKSGVFSPNKMVWANLSKKEQEDLSIAPTDFPKLIDLDWSTINKEQAGWVERWHKEIKK